jgi:hypothetical protein
MTRSMSAIVNKLLSTSALVVGAGKTLPSRNWLIPALTDPAAALVKFG